MIISSTQYGVLITHFLNTSQEARCKVHISQNLGINTFKNLAPLKYVDYDALRMNLDNMSVISWQSQRDP